MLTLCAMSSSKPVPKVGRQITSSATRKAPGGSSAAPTCSETKDKTPSPAIRGKRGHGIHRDALRKTTNAQAMALMKKHGKHLRALAKKMNDHKVAIDEQDLFQAGLIGLIQAFHQHDRSTGLDLWRYAYKRVRGEMIQAIRNALEFHRSAWCELPATVYDPELKRPINRFLPIVEPFNVRFHDRGEGGPEEKHQSWVAMMAPLEDRERHILALYFIRELTLDNIGALYDITESRAHQIVTASLKKLRSTMQ